MKAHSGGGTGKATGTEGGKKKGRRLSKGGLKFKDPQEAQKKPELGEQLCILRRKGKSGIGYNRRSDWGEKKRRKPSRTEVQNSYSQGVFGFMHTGKGRGLAREKKMWGRGKRKDLR